MITAKMINTLTDFENAPIAGVSTGDTVTIVAVRGDNVEVETQNADRYIASIGDVVIDLDVTEMSLATTLIDFTLRLAALPNQFADLLERTLIMDNLTVAGGDVSTAKAASDQIFTLELLTFLSLLSEMTGKIASSKA